MALGLVTLTRSLNTVATGLTASVNSFKDWNIFLSSRGRYFLPAPGPHPRRELSPTPRLGFPCPRLGVAAGARSPVRGGTAPAAPVAMPQPRLPTAPSRPSLPAYPAATAHRASSPR